MSFKEKMDASTMKKGAAQKSWPLTATVGSLPPKSPRSPCSSAETAELWDRYEKLAADKAKERDGLRHGRSEQNRASPSRTRLDARFRHRPTATPGTTVSICKTCQQPISYASAICERCIKTVVVGREAEETTPPLSPSEGTAGSTDAANAVQATPRSEVITPSYSSPKRPSFCPLPSHAPAALLNRRKKSPSEARQPCLRLDTTSSPSCTTRSPISSPPMTPTSPQVASPAAPATTRSICSTRRSSLANVTMVPKPGYLHVRNDSGTPSEFSTLFQTISTVTTPPGSVHRFGYPLQHATSVWDDWDTDEEDDDEHDMEADRAGIASWMGRRKGKARGGKPSLDQSVEGACGEGEPARAEPSMKGASASTVGTEKVRKPSGILRALSCGCGVE